MTLQLSPNISRNCLCCILFITFSRNVFKS
jgi:hypothetical protein